MDLRLDVRKTVKLLCCILLFAFAALGPAHAQEVNPDQIRAQVAEWTRLLDRFSREASTLRLDEADVRHFTEEAGRIKGEATALKDTAAAQVAETRELLDSMGEVAQGATESPEAAAQRKDLQERLGRAEGWQKQAELVMARADQLVDRVAAKRIALFAQTVVKRGPSPLVPQVWIDAGRELGALAAVIGASLRGWFDRVLDWHTDVGPAMLVVLAAGLVGLGAGLAISSYLIRRFTRREAAGAISPLDVQLGAAARFVAQTGPLVLALGGAWAVWPPPELNRMG